MTEKEYRQHPAISRSELWKIKESPEKFKYYKENPEEPTPSLVFGQLFHKLALQPESFDDEFAVMPNVDRRTKEGKALWNEFENETIGKTRITATDYLKATEMCNILTQHPIKEVRIYIKKLLSGDKEKSFFWKDELTGEDCKCCVDCVSKVGETNIIVDLKSVSKPKAKKEEFERIAIDYGYDFQSGMYLEGVQKCTGKNYTFVFIVVEKEPPYAVNILQADKLFVKRGYDIFRELIGIYHDCKINDNWYGYLGKFNMINNLALPAWLAKEIE